MNLLQRLLFGRKKIEEKPIKQTFRHIPKYQSDFDLYAESEKRKQNHDNTIIDLETTSAIAGIINIIGNLDDSKTSVSENSSNGFDGGFGGGDYSGGGSSGDWDSNSSNSDSYDSNYSNND